MSLYEVLVHRDSEAGVWWAESHYVPGLVAEASTGDAMMAELRLIVPEMLAANGNMPSDGQIKLHVVMDQTEDLTTA